MELVVDDRRTRLHPHTAGCSAFIVANKEFWPESATRKRPASWSAYPEAG